MKDKFINYLTSPTLENFMSFRSAVMEADDFHPYSSELDNVPALIEAGSYDKIIELISENIWPNYMLSPEAHLYWSFAHHKLDHKEDAEFEGMVSDLLLQGIDLTGDGTKAKPLLVSRISDEYDYLRKHKLTLDGQGLVEIDGNEFDVISTKEQDDIWFDVTEIRRKLDKELGI